MSIQSDFLQFVVSCDAQFTLKCCDDYLKCLLLASPSLIGFQTLSKANFWEFISKNRLCHPTNAFSIQFESFKGVTGAANHFFDQLRASRISSGLIFLVPWSMWAFAVLNFCSDSFLGAFYRVFTVPWPIKASEGSKLSFNSIWRTFLA